MKTKTLVPTLMLALAAMTFTPAALADYNTGTLLSLKD